MPCPKCVIITLYNTTNLVSHCQYHCCARVDFAFFLLRVCTAFTKRYNSSTDYWSMSVGGCSGFGPTPAPQPKLKCKQEYKANFCLGNSVNLKDLRTATPTDCCAQCSDTPGCKGWAWGRSRTHGGNHTCYLKSQIRTKDKGNCTSSCMHADCFPKQVPVTDLWRAAPGATEGPAIGWNNTCKKAPSTPVGQRPDTCDAGPRGDHWFDGYEDAVFEQQVLTLLAYSRVLARILITSTHCHHRC